MTLSLEYRPFELALEQPFETAQGTISTRRGFLIRAERDGVIGIGEATPLAGWTESEADCRDALDRAVDAAPAGSDAALEAVDGTAAARHGVALAVADLFATRSARPLYQYLGRWDSDSPRSAERHPWRRRRGDDSRRRFEGRLPWLSVL